ncbi:hypothetical protein LIER_41473 [Lithospermum erythrorhizon]|uniref:Uncharacterized protein n=1 Tax=Lithospermum erythrorhizon TaxID=34254 RepID=A0AAV3RD79_LITER
MERFTSKYGTHKNIRYVSLPARSHPTTIKIEQILNKLKTLETQFVPNSEVICNELRGLTELHEGIEELLALQNTRQAIAENKHDIRVDELLEDSMTFIDICSNRRDSIMQFKQGILDVQSSFRRGKIDVSEYIDYSSKNMRKDVARFLSMPEQRKTISTCLSNSSNQFYAILKVLLDANVVTMSIFRSLLQFLSVKVLKPRPNRWSLISKLMNKGELKGEDRTNTMNELEDVDLALGELQLQFDSCKIVEAEKIEVAKRKLEDLEITVEAIENELEDVLRQLIRTRASLLNIFSH